jgi:uncharacterized repeat protein (TIGR03803 family)
MVGLVLLFVVVGNAGAASRESVLYDFHGKDGNVPSSLMLGADGALYGTTVEGGTNSCLGQGCGVVFRLVRGSDGKWRETVLHNFAGTDGEFPSGTLVADKGGNLYGTTPDGGPSCSQLGCGVVFELLRGKGDKWTFKVLHNFAVTDGANPYAGMIFDSLGNLYGTASGGGNVSPCINQGGCGVVFELTPNGKGNWTETVVYAFDGTDGGGPLGSVTFDSSGNLYGTTSYGGGGGGGTVFKLTPGKNGQWSERVVHPFSFDTRDGYEPGSGLIFDSSGNLYGTTPFGGTKGEQGWGTAFELAPGAGGKWKETILRTFDRAKFGGGDVSSGLASDSAGNFYGTAGWGGRYDCPSGGGLGCGVIFKVSQKTNGKWSETVLHSFGSGEDGAGPGGDLVRDSGGHLFGGTGAGGHVGGPCGQEGCGVVYEVTP